jgi:hypothetical protein
MPLRLIEPDVNKIMSYQDGSTLLHAIAGMRGERALSPGIRGKATRLNAKTSIIIEVSRPA